jgi:hypothetical protein
MDTTITDCFQSWGLGVAEAGGLELSVRCSPL